MEARKKIVQPAQQRPPEFMYEVAPGTWRCDLCSEGGYPEEMQTSAKSQVRENEYCEGCNRNFINGEWH